MVAWLRTRFSLAVVLSLLLGVAIPGQAPGGEALKGAQSVPVLRVLRECPATEPTCVVFDINLLLNGDRAPDVERHPNVVSVTFDNTTGFGVAVLNVRGRLNGGPEKKHRIVFDPFIDGLRCQDFHGAIVGVSGKTGGTILTDAGRLEITDETLSFGDRFSLRLIHEETLSIAQHLSSGWETYDWKEELIVSPEGRIMWGVKGQCLDYESGKLFQIVPKDECQGNELVDATDAEIKRVREGNVFIDAYVNERLNIDLRRLKNAPYFVRIWGVACT